MDKNEESDKNEAKEMQMKTAKMQKLFGFDLNNFKSWTSLVKLLNRPEDPSSLAVFRILFGILMMIDIPNERGMADADVEYGIKSTCYFPLFDFLKPLPAQWMVVIYAIMFIGALGITLGFKFRISCFCFMLPYWYLFLLDKTTWNNHSYLYGLISFQLFLSDANRYLSIDGLLDASIRNSHIPLWNYCLVRFQVFVVYFIAGLKKTEFDWVAGYSMEGLASHWIFDPFKFFMTNEQITLIVVHHGGLFIDLFVGYFLFFDKTRIFGTIISCSFHIMNSRMFNIGMFPYTMLATTMIFYSNDWPKRLFTKILNEKVDPDTCKFYVSKLSEHCIYEKIENKGNVKKITKPKTTKTTFYHKFFTVFTFFYIGEQLFLPYSHFITKGYNNWTNGLYGYSWDMMVHSWHTQHIKIHFIDKNTNQTQYLNPKAWTSRRRWSSHADMIFQYSHCIKSRLHAMNYTNIELYMDVWRSMNHRFNQRQIDPRVNLLEAKWSPFEKTEWIIPLMTELSDWRSKLNEIEERFRKENRNFELTFVTDLNGLTLENYVSEYLNTTIEVLNGQVNVELEVGEVEASTKKKRKETKRFNVSLSRGEKLSVPSKAYHRVHTISNEPSCFFYIYINETEIILSERYDRFYANMLNLINETYESLARDGVNLNSDEEAYWKAYNKTLQTNAENFLYLISFNKSDENFELRKEVSMLVSLFGEEKLSKIYDAFTSQFYTDFKNKFIKPKQSILKVTMNKLSSYLNRFRQRFEFKK